MKKIFYLLTVMVLLACNEKTKKEYHAEYDEIREELENLKIKLAATEAQLLNVQAELSKHSIKDTSLLESE